MAEFHHVSVLLEECLAGLKISPSGTYVDATLGGAGHSSAIAAKLNAEGHLVGIDQDPAALAAAEKRLAGSLPQITLLQGNFRQLGFLLEQAGIEEVDGVLFDLGVSSHQLDTPERGFSYMPEGPLDMRMDPEGKLTASTIIHKWPEEDIVRILFEYGEEKFARRIAQEIIKYRSQKEFTNTLELAEVIKQAIPAATRRTGPHPAKRSFQALRIAVNQELEILEEAYKAAVHKLKPGGRLAVITFHSLEDRITKQVFQKLAKPCVCPPKFPICACGLTPEIKLMGKPIGPSIQELEENPRARSAKLRVVEKI